MRKRQSGVTLIEILLVMVIVSAIFYIVAGFIQQKTLQFKINRAATDIQEILNAALSYYVTNGQWPTAISCLQGNAGGCFVAYLSRTKTYANPIGGLPYLTSSSAGQFTVIALFQEGAPKSYAHSAMLAGRLPSAYAQDAMTYPAVCTSTSGACLVSVSVPAPALPQNSVEGTAVNFGSVYHNGACVPVPVCPSSQGSMIASIAVVPTSVTGANAAPQTPSAPSPTCNPKTQSGCTVQAFPITSYSAFATPAAQPDGSSSGPNSGPYSCQTMNSGSPTPAPCYADYDQNGAPVGAPLKGGSYWRVCLNVVTEAGVVTPNENTWGQLVGTMMAITRCINPTTEKKSSDFTVWSQ